MLTAFGWVVFGMAVWGLCIVMQAAELRQAAQMAAEEGRRLVYLDEFMLTKRTMLTHAWTLPRTNIKIDMKQLNERPVAVVAAASRENGVEYYQCFKKSVNKQKFNQFLDGMREKWPNSQVTLVMDNLAVHISKAVRSKMDQLDYKAAFTPKVRRTHHSLTCSLCSILLTIMA